MEISIKELETISEETGKPIYILLDEIILNQTTKP
jgi:hypothetical protein